MAEVGFGGSAKVLSWTIELVPYSRKTMLPRWFEESVTRTLSEAWIPPRTSLWSTSPSLEPAMSTAKRRGLSIVQPWMRNPATFRTEMATGSEMECPAQSRSTFAAFRSDRQADPPGPTARSDSRVKHPDEAISPHSLTTWRGAVGSTTQLG